MNEELLNKLNSIIESIDNNTRKLDNLELGLLSVNKDLIEQNMKLSTSLLGNAPVQDEVRNTVEKELFYESRNGRINVHGPGTFDNKDVLKANGKWDGINKAWNMNITQEELLELFPNITEKNI